VTPEERVDTAVSVSRALNMLRPPEPGSQIKVRFEPEPGESQESANVPMDGLLVAITPAGLWWAPDYDTTYEFVPWRLICLIEARRGGTQ
jgi:hypothetical protein